MAADTPDPLLDEIRQLAEALAKCDDVDVVDFAGQFAAEYRTLLDGEIFMQAIEAWEMTQEEMERKSERRIRNARVQLRNSLAALLEWAKATGRL